MKKNLTYSSDFICTDCGTIIILPRFYCKSREKYHIKDIECYNCKSMKKFIELKNADVVKKELEFMPELTEQEKFIYDLLHKNEEKAKIR